MKIVLLDAENVNTGDLSWDSLGVLGELIIYPQTEKNEIVSRAKDADAIFVNKLAIGKDIMTQLPNLKYIGIFATGYNIIDITAAKELGITVCNVPGYSTHAVAQLTIALLLELCHHVGEYSKKVHGMEWDSKVNFTLSAHPLIELENKTIGIIGYGDIGHHISVIASALGMNVIFYNPREKDHPLFAQQVSFDELLKRSDIITLHCPLFENNTKMINKETISKMKDGAFLLNTARGGLVDEEALADALNTDKLAGAGLDVFSMEPIKENNPLLKAKNCILTPHIGWTPVETRKRLIALSTKNLEAFIQGKPINTVQ